MSKSSLVLWLVFLLTCASLAWAQPGDSQIDEAVARAGQKPTTSLEQLAERVGAESATHGRTRVLVWENGDPTVVLWSEDSPAALALISQALVALHSLGNWEGSVVWMIGPPLEHPPLFPRLLVRVVPSEELTSGQIAIPRADYLSQVDLIDIEVPPATGRDSALTLADLLLTLQSDSLDPLDDSVVHIEKFSSRPVSRVVLSLKTYSQESRRRNLDVIARLISRAAGGGPPLKVMMPRADSHPDDIQPDWAVRLRKRLTEGGSTVFLEPLIVDDHRHLELSHRWNCQAVAVFLGQRPNGPTARDAAAAGLVRAILTVFKPGS